MKISNNSELEYS